MTQGKLKMKRNLFNRRAGQSDIRVKLQRLTALGKDEIKSELSDLSNQINKSSQY